MIYIGELILILINIAMAYIHANMIKDGKKILHGLWGGGYIIVATLFALVNHWILLPEALLIRKVFFDLSLNKFRGFDWFYVSESTTSIIDRLHNFLFGNRPYIYYSVYFVLLITINILWHVLSQQDITLKTPVQWLLGI